jgi:hypothetical protein
MARNQFPGPDKQKHIAWAQLLKHPFKFDVLKCNRRDGRMKLMGVVFDQPVITTTLRALGLPVLAPPAFEKTRTKVQRQKGLF